MEETALTFFCPHSHVIPCNSIHAVIAVHVSVVHGEFTATWPLRVTSLPPALSHGEA